jgi:uncharacterized protein
LNAPPVPDDLQRLATAIRDAPGLRSKRDLALLAPQGIATDGDDAAALPHGAGHLVLCGEAILPALVAGDPFAAGAAAVATNVADVRAMGGRPLGLVDTLVSPDRDHARLALEGLTWAADLLGVPIVGGHTTLGGPPALSAFCAGRAGRVLRAAAARPGDVLLAAFSLEGHFRDDPPIFTSLRTREPALLRADGEALVEVAERELCHAARDVSMPGVAGSLLQMLELCDAGAVLDLARLPRPAAVALERWVLTFPSFGFVLAAPPQRVEAAVEAFARRGLTCAACGAFDDSRVLRIARGGATAMVWDLEKEPLTGLGRR